MRISITGEVLKPPSTQDIESHRSNCALLQMIKDMETSLQWEYTDAARYDDVSKEVKEHIAQMESALQTLCENWEK